MNINVLLIHLSKNGEGYLCVDRRHLKMIKRRELMKHVEDKYDEKIIKLIEEDR